MIKDLRFKEFFESVTKRFSSEELFFGLTTIITIVIDYNSIVPAICTLLLLAFYYLFFGWLLFRNERKTNFLFSIISGIVYSICLVCMVIIIIKDFYSVFFYCIQFVILIIYFMYLRKAKKIELYKANHYIRIAIILFLNIFISIFK